MLKKSQKSFPIALVGLGISACLLLFVGCTNLTTDQLPVTTEEHTKFNDPTFGSSTYAPNAMIRSVFPWGLGVSCNSTFIAVSFNQPMVKSSLKLTIEPPVSQGNYNLYANSSYLKVDLLAPLTNGMRYKVTVTGKTQAGAELVDVLNPWDFTVGCAETPA